MIYTCYFAKANRLDMEEYCPVVITRSKPPSWFNHKCIWRRDLSPDWDTLKAYRDGLINWAEYRRRYIKLIGLPENADSIKEELELLSIREGKPVLLLCYEKDVCHRFILGEFLNVQELEI